MDEMPISLTRAAKILDVNPVTISVLVTTHEIPVVTYPGVKFKGLNPEAFERLKEVSAPFKQTRRSNSVPA